MAIPMDPSLPMPTTAEALSYSAEASKLLPTSAYWLAVQRKAAACLRMFNNHTGFDGAVWFGVREFRNGDNQLDWLVTMYFTTDAPLQPGDLDRFEQPFAGDLAPWVRDGIHPRADDAFPALYIRGTTLYQVWGESNGQLVYPKFVRDYDGMTVAWMPYNEAQMSDFLPHIRHAVGTRRGVNADMLMRKERMKIAFAMAVVQDIVAADGVIDPGEVAFLRENFPPRRLTKYKLADPGERAAVYQEARRRLAGMLGYHEKLALLSTFFATCSADGSIDPSELVVLKQACEDLGMPRSAVAQHLAKLW